MNTIRTLDSTATWLAKALAVLAGIFLVTMMTLACANMVLRTVTAGLKGTVELVGFLGAVLTAFSLAFAQIKKGHIAVGLLARFLPGWLQRSMQVLQLLISCAFFLYASVETSRWGLHLIETGELSETLRIIYHPFVFAAALGCVAIAFVLFVDLLKTLAPAATQES